MLFKFFFTSLQYFSYIVVMYMCKMARNYCCGIVYELYKHVDMAGLYFSLISELYLTLPLLL